MPRPLLTLALLLQALCTLAADLTPSSNLASGQWRKISVTQSGIYRISANDLRQMGFPDPNNVRVYGAAGHQLAYAAASDSRDDISLIPAYHDNLGLIFYAEGPDILSQQSDGSYTPSLNAYSHKAYYFLTSSSTTDTPTTAPSTSPTNDTQTISAYDNVFIYAPQSTNISSSGREWVGQQLNSSKRSFSIPLSLTVIPNTKALIRYRLASDVLADITLTLSIDDLTVLSRDLSPTTLSNANWTSITANTSFTTTSSSLSTATFHAPLTTTDDRLWISYLALTVQSPLDLSTGSLLFRANAQRKANAPVQFSLSNAPSDLQIWDVTDPQKPTLQTISLNSSTASFIAPSRATRTYAAFSPSASLPAPTDEGQIDNQNLHSHQSVNYLVITPPLLLDVAQKFCDLHAHASNFSTRAVLTTQIYNEFSAARPEPTAIRNYIKMLFDRGANTPDQLLAVLLLGSGSYDNFDLSNPDNLIPTYQTENSYNAIYSYPIEDFFGWLEDGEGASENRATLDVGIGRIPARTIAEAQNYLNKAYNYTLNPTQGEWRAKAIFVGLHGDTNEHQTFANYQASQFEELYPDMETIRIFSEAYPAVKESSGTSYPQAITTARNHINSGTSLFHYTGHSNPNQLHGPYLTSEYVSNLSNAEHPFVFVSASCDVSPFDCQPKNLATIGLFNPNGAYIATFAATRDVYGSGNYNVTRQFVKHLYATNPDGSRLTFGQALCKAKQTATKGAGSLKYILLGDPGLRISTPSGLYASLDTINSTPANEQTEPLKALALSSLQGSIRLDNGSIDTSFNGSIRLTLYDKKQTRSTSGISSGSPLTYEEYATKLFSGRVNVTHGLFSANFILSKEFDLSIGYGRLHMYASASDGRDAMGSNEALLVGDIQDTDLTDTIGPAISAWVDYPRDTQGNPASSTPYLYVSLSDPQGINVSGQGIGHDISLIIDSLRSQALSLNDYFAFQEGNTPGGLVSFPLTDISLTSHTFTIKAWDNLNNSSSATFLININPSASKINISQELLSISSNLQLSIASDAFGSSIALHSRLYTPSGILVANQDLRLQPSNGTLQTTIPINAKLTSPGVYILRVDVSGNGRKARITKKIIFGRQ